MTFPKDFIWGAASSSYQVEGAWNADGKGPSIWDDFTHDKGKGHILYDETGDVACDFYHRMDDDVALMKQLGLKAFRFSVSWPRVLPNGTGEINSAGLAFYDRFVDKLLENGIKPWLTLYHWDLPSVLQHQGGWLNPETVLAFANYAEIIGRHFDGRVKNYMGINEPQCVVSLGHDSLVYAPGIKLNNQELLTAYHHLALAQSLAARALRKTSHTPLNIGLAMCGRICYPETPDEANTKAAYDAMFKLTEDNWLFSFNIASDPILLKHYPEDAPNFIRAFGDNVPKSDWDIMADFDFYGANIYNGYAVDKSGNPSTHVSGIPRTALKWSVSPKSMRYGTEFLYKRYGLPIVVTENGQSCNDRVFLDGGVHDPDRIDFLTRYIREMKAAMDAGVPINGYMHWSFSDNFEWSYGYNERFGLVYIDYQTQTRILKDSALWYADVIRTNGMKI